jgi:hypothetical protein
VAFRQAFASRVSTALPAAWYTQDAVQSAWNITDANFVAKRF